MRVAQGILAATPPRHRAARYSPAVDAHPLDAPKAPVPASAWPLLALPAIGALAGAATSAGLLAAIDGGSTVLEPYLTFFGALTGGMLGGLAGAFRLHLLSRTSPAWARWGWFWLLAAAVGAIASASLWVFTLIVARAAGC